MSLTQMMNIDTAHELKGRTWWWWWWISFFHNPDQPERVKQLVILWATRNARRMKIHDHVWRRRDPPTWDDERVSFEGLTASWYYDGTRMRDPLFIDNGPTLSSWGEDSGLVMDNGNRYGFEGKPGSFRIFASRPGVEISLQAEEFSPFLTRITETGKTYLGHLGYSMHKIRGSRTTGVIRIDGREEHVSGTSYFQKVRINSPTSPWYWGIFHSERGHYIDYFMPHIGPAALRRGYSHRSFLDWGERYLSSGWQIYDPDDGVLHRVKNPRMEKRYDGDLPTFILSGDDGTSRFRMVMEAYARACWRVEQPFLRLFSTILYYNEYPVNVRELEFRTGSKVITLDDLGWVMGNCEHSWGIV